MSFHPKKILVATDFSSCSKQAVDDACDLAKTYGATLTVAHVIPLSSYLDFSAGIEGQSFAALDYETDVREAAKISIRDEKARLSNLGLAAEFTTGDGPPALAIAKIAKEGDFDLVVIGTHGRTGLQHVLLGSVAEGVVRHCTMPVLTVHPSPSLAATAKGASQP